jgi:peptidoglycan/LPS O-acetylase OafA/YrhL
LYLWHLPIFKFVPVHAGDWPALVRLAIALALTALAVALSWRLVERPANRRRHRFDPHRAPSEATPPPSDGDEVGGVASVQHVAQ